MCFFFSKTLKPKSYKKLNIDLTSTLPLYHRVTYLAKGCFRRKKNSWNLLIPSLEAETEGPRSYSSPAWAIKCDPVSKILKKITGCFLNKIEVCFHAGQMIWQKGKNVTLSNRRGMEKGKSCRSDMLVLVIGQNYLMMIVKTDSKSACCLRLGFRFILAVLEQKLSNSVPETVLKYFPGPPASISWVLGL